ncbi:hypothetical protein H0O03_04740 [Candidatus Micrarchaeota archaeon]|nr:hypothetical protein [Candidatus Micrarchaeota archaeon]
MAKVIASTPLLTGKDAEKFLAFTERAEKASDSKRAGFLEECLHLYLSHKF